jgi:hypothetical protein
MSTFTSSLLWIRLKAAAIGDGLAYRVGVHVEVVAEQLDQHVTGGFRELHDEVDVARHPGHRVVVERHRAGQHVRQPGRVEPPGHDRQDLQLLASVHHAHPARVASSMDLY